MVPLQNFSQGMLLTEDMISFHTVNNAATVQLVICILLLYKQTKQHLLTAQCCLTAFYFGLVMIK